MKKHQYGRVLVEGDFQFATVTETHCDGRKTVLEEFDNRTSTDTNEPDAFKRALKFAYDLHHDTE